MHPLIPRTAASRAAPHGGYFPRHGRVCAAAPRYSAAVPGYSAAPARYSVTKSLASAGKNLPSPPENPASVAEYPADPATPTKWTYKAIYRVGDHQVGQWSPEVSVIAGGWKCDPGCPGP